MRADDYNDITNLIHRYGDLMDAGDFDGVGVLLAHALWKTREVTLHGGNELASILKQIIVTYEDGRPWTKHLITNVTIEVDPDRMVAGATSSVTVLQAVPPDFPLQVIFSNRHVDRFERVDGAWRFSERVNVHDLEGDVGHHKKTS